ncbi:MAG: DUF3499 family protein [Egibacteraceae bacterium]
MTDPMRTCSRAGCRWPAAASLSFRYASRQVWLLDLRDPEPSFYDLCPHHADVLVVPRGWDRVDQRTVAEVVHEPSAQGFAERAAARRGVPMREPALTGATRAAVPARVNRYEDLARELPRLAAEFAALCSHGEPGLGADAPALVPEAQPPSRVIVPIEVARRPLSEVVKR